MPRPYKKRRVADELSAAENVFSNNSITCSSPDEQPVAMTPSTDDEESNAVDGLRSLQNYHNGLVKSNQEVVADDDPSAMLADATSKEAASRASEAEDKRYRNYQVENWMEKVQHVRKFKFQHGHCKIPHDYPQNKQLARWAKRQRYQYCLFCEGRASSLTPERIQTLDELGFVWDLQETAWNESFDALCRFTMVQGHANVPSEWPDNRPLGKWVKCQRRQYKLYEAGKPSSMTKERVSRLEAIGFLWVVGRHVPPEVPKDFESPWHEDPGPGVVDIVV